MSWLSYMDKKCLQMCVYVLHQICRAWGIFNECLNLSAFAFFCVPFQKHPFWCFMIGLWDHSRINSSKLFDVSLLIMSPEPSEHTVLVIFFLKWMIFYCSEQIRCNLLAEPSVTLRWIVPSMLASITICFERMSRTWSCWHPIYTTCEWHDVTKLPCSSFKQYVWSQTAKAQSRRLCWLYRECSSFVVLPSIAHSVDKFQ